MASEVKIEYGEKPKKASPNRGLKWQPVIEEVVAKANGRDAKVAVRDTQSAASGIAQTLRKTAEKIEANVTIATRREPDTDEYGVWVTPEGDAKPKAKSKSKSTSKSKSSSSKSSGSSSRRRKVKAKS